MESLISYLYCPVVMSELTGLPPALEAAIQQLESSQPWVLATRYLAVASLTIVVFDGIENFPEEWDLIWKGRPGLERNMFLLHRAIVPLGLACAVLMSCGAWLDDVGCKFLLGMLGFMAVLSIGLADGLVTMEVWQLWDCDRAVLRYMRAAFGLTYAGSTAFILVAFIRIIDYFDFEPHFQVCALRRSPRLLTGTWACGLMFELSVFGSTLWNVLSKPRSGNARVTELLYRDGSLFFVAVMVLRLTNMITSLISQPDRFFTLIFPNWAFVTILVNRLIMNQSRERKRIRRNVQMVNDLGAPRAAPPIMISRTITQEYEMDVRSESLSATINFEHQSQQESQEEDQDYDADTRDTSDRPMQPPSSHEEFRLRLNRVMGIPDQRE